MADDVRRQESDSDNTPATLVSVPPLEKTVFASWDEFHAYLADYQRRTFQVYSVRTGTPVSTRNKRIRERYARRGEAVPPGELLPEEMGMYTKAVVCTHHGKPRSRSKGVRKMHSRAINCMASITLVLRQDFASGKWMVHVSSHTARHNHALSGDLYRSHPRVRRVTDPNVLHTVQALEKAQVKPARILEYVRENTNKEVTKKDVHNLLHSMRQQPPPPPPSSAEPPAPVPRTARASAPAASADSEAAPVARTASIIRTDTSIRQTAPFSIRRSGPAPPAPPEAPSQYGKFLASFDVGKHISELMAEMEPNHFARCFTELKRFRQIIKNGRVPAVTARGADGNMLPSIPTTERPRQEVRLSSANVAATASVLNASTATGEATHSLISPQ